MAGEGGCRGAARVAGRRARRWRRSGPMMRRRGRHSSPSPAALLPRRRRCWTQPTPSSSTPPPHPSVTEPTAATSGPGVRELDASGSAVPEVGDAGSEVPELAASGCAVPAVGPAGSGVLEFTASGSAIPAADVLSAGEVEENTGAEYTTVYSCTPTHGRSQPYQRRQTASVYSPPLWYVHRRRHLLRVRCVMAVYFLLFGVYFFLFGVYTVLLAATLVCTSSSPVCHGCTVTPPARTSTLARSTRRYTPRRLRAGVLLVGVVYTHAGSSPSATASLYSSPPPCTLAAIFFLSGAPRIYIMSPLCMYLY